MGLDAVLNMPPYDQVIVPGIDGSGTVELDAADVLRWTFSEEMDQQSAESALNLDPSVDGTFYWPDDAVMVFVPEVGLEPGTAYRTTISTEAKDASGLSLASNAVSRFVIPATALHVESIIAGTDVWLPPYSADDEKDFTVSADPPKITVVFSQSMSSTQSRQSAIDAINLVLLIGTFDTSPTNYAWTPDHKELTITYRGTLSPAVEESVLFVIEGGPQGVRGPSGDYLNEDLEQLLYVR
jgi:hypothetical protein